MKDWETNKYLDCLWIDRLNLTPIQMDVGDADRTQCQESKGNRGVSGTMLKVESMLLGKYLTVRDYNRLKSESEYE